MVKSTEWLSIKLTNVSFMSATSQKTLMSKGMTMTTANLSSSVIVLSPTQKPPFGGLMWRRVQDSNLCIVIHDDGLAIRCITTLPTLHQYRGTQIYLYDVSLNVNIKIKNNPYYF